MVLTLILLTQNQSKKTKPIPRLPKPNLKSLKSFLLAKISPRLRVKAEMPWKIFFTLSFSSKNSTRVEKAHQGLFSIPIRLNIPSKFLHRMRRRVLRSLI
jgi:hypothetical protein